MTGSQLQQIDRLKECDFTKERKIGTCVIIVTAVAQSYDKKPA